MADYQTKVSVDFTLKGALITWSNVEEPDLSVILPRIEEHAQNLRQTYKVWHDVSDTSKPLKLELSFKKAPGRADLVRIKGDVFAVLVDTSWGGPG